MKKNRIILSVFLIALIVIGWGSFGMNKVETKGDYSKSLKEADSYFKQELYQKAIIEYETAFNTKPSKKIMDKLLDAYSKSYEDGTSTQNEYAEAMEKACTKYEKSEKYWKRLIKFYMKNVDYNSAYSAVQKAMRADVTSEKMNQLYNEVLYVYEVKSKNYYKFTSNLNGYYSLYDGTNWGVADSNGDWLYECNYEYASPVNETTDVLLKTEKDTRVIDSKGIVQHILDNSYSEYKALGSDLVPVKNENDAWQYLSLDSKKLVGEEYKNCSSFVNDKAVVSDGKSWSLVDKKFKKVSDKKFSDVKLHSNGEFIGSDIMIASDKDGYHMYDEKGKAMNSFSAKDMDVCKGEYIAYQSDKGKWGFVDKKGKVVLKPVYDEAKSFSNGLAAVKTGDSWGFINDKFEEVIKAQFLDADYFSKNGVCLVSSSEKEFYFIKLRFNEK